MILINFNSLMSIEQCHTKPHIQMKTNIVRSIYESTLNLRPLTEMDLRTYNWSGMQQLLF